MDRVIRLSVIVERIFDNLLSCKREICSRVNISSILSSKEQIAINKSILDKYFKNVFRHL